MDSPGDDICRVFLCVQCPCMYNHDACILQLHVVWSGGVYCCEMESCLLICLPGVGGFQTYTAFIPSPSLSLFDSKLQGERVRCSSWMFACRVAILSDSPDQPQTQTPFNITFPQSVQLHQISSSSCCCGKQLLVSALVFDKHIRLLFTLP